MDSHLACWLNTESQSRGQRIVGIDEARGGRSAGSLPTFPQSCVRSEFQLRVRQVPTLRRPRPRENIPHPELLAHLINVIQLIGGGFIRPENPEIRHIHFMTSRKNAPRGRVFSACMIPGFSNFSGVLAEVRQPERLSGGRHWHESWSPCGVFPRAQSP